MRESGETMPTYLPSNLKLSSQTLETKTLVSFQVNSISEKWTKCKSDLCSIRLSRPQEVIVAGAPISEVVQLDGSTFIPRGGTPLLDATGLLIGRARVEAAAREATGLPKQQILFVSITDGDENSSNEYSLEQIKKLYKECEAAGWTFVFISAALDAYGDAGRLGVKYGNIQAFDKSAHGTQLTFASLSAKTTDFRNNVRNLRVDLNYEFFGSDKPAEDDRNAQENHCNSVYLLWVC